MGKPKKVMLTGCSGVGKTTLAKWMAENFHLPFISGSYSDLVPETRYQKHSDMISKDPQEIYKQDMQVINLRNKQFSNKRDFVSDRSYFDSAAYLIQKLSHHIPECDTEHFINTCERLMAEQCTHLIFIPFTKNFLENWDMEDNSKRVLNRYYQFEVSQILYGILDLWNFKVNRINSFFSGGNLDCIGTITCCGKKIKVLILDETDFHTRQYLVSRFING